MKSDFLVALTQLAAEKNLPREVVLQAVEAALASAYKKDSELAGNLVVQIDRDRGTVRAYQRRTVVSEVSDEEAEMTMEAARKYKPHPQMGEFIDIEVIPANAGRIAAQTAKQVVLQRLRDAERQMVFEEFSTRESDLISGVIQRLEPKHAVIDLGKTEGILPVSEQVRGETYRPGLRMKFYLLEVHRSLKGPQLILSRTHKSLLKRLLELEVPEIHKGVVEISAIAREPGHRSKVAVTARQEGVDAVGSCVGPRGIRIQNIVNELNGERIDVVEWDRDPAKFVANALSPAQVIHVTISDDDNTASVAVPEKQLSLAIGKEGQNARLAAKLTGWRIDIKPEAVAAPARPAPPKAEGRPRARPAAQQRDGEIDDGDAQPWMEFIEEAAVAQGQPVAQDVEIPTEAAAPEADVKTEKEAAIRFAEDIFGRAAATTGNRVAATTTGKKKSKKDDEEVAEVSGRPKRAKRAAPIIDDESDDVDISAEESDLGGEESDLDGEE